MHIARLHRLASELGCALVKIEDSAKDFGQVMYFIEWTDGRTLYTHSALSRDGVEAVLKELPVNQPDERRAMIEADIRAHRRHAFKNWSRELLPAEKPMVTARVVDEISAPLRQVSADLIATMADTLEGAGYDVSAMSDDEITDAFAKRQAFKAACYRDTREAAIARKEEAWACKRTRRFLEKNARVTAQWINERDPKLRDVTGVFFQGAWQSARYEGMRLPA